MARQKAKSKKQSTKTQPTINHTKLPNVLQITKSTAYLLWTHKKLFIGITLIYGLLNLVLVQGFAATTDVASLKQQLNQIFTGNFGSLATSFSVFVVLVGSAGNGSSPTAGAYQFFLGLIVSLAIIWALRQIYADTKIRIRDAYYNGMTPLVPFLLVLLVIGLQLLPMLIGSTLYSVIINNGIAVYMIEKLLWLGVFLALSLASLYMISSSTIALYIVTLPGMTPMKALRSARHLVKRRRWVVMRKLLFLPLILFIVTAIIMLPIIIFATPLAQWVFFLLTMFALTVIHTYIYNLYRELIGE